MRLISWGRTAAVSVLALSLLGCAAAGERPMKETGFDIRKNETQFCSWTVDRAPSGKVITVHLHNKATNKAGENCEVVETQGKLFIGDTAHNGREILDISPGAVEFLTKGTCRYCYLNAYGGMTCISYPGC